MTRVRHLVAALAVATVGLHPGLSCAAGAYTSGTHAAGAYTSGTDTPGAYASGEAAPGAYTSDAVAPGAYASGTHAPGAYTSGTTTAGAYTAGDDLPSICRNLVAATPDADLAYQPGIDTHGRRIAPADLPPTDQTSAGPNAIGQSIDFPLTVNLARTLGLRGYPYNRFGAGTEGTIGTLSLRGNRAYFNGQPLSDPEQDRLAVLCMKPR